MEPKFRKLSKEELIEARKKFKNDQKKMFIIFFILVLLVVLVICPMTLLATQFATLVSPH